MNCALWFSGAPSPPERLYGPAPLAHSISTGLAVANLDVEALGVAKMSRPSSPERPVFVAHQLSSTLQARIASDSLTGLAKVQFKSQLVKTNRALVNYTRRQDG